MLKIAKDLFDLLYPIGIYVETSNANWTPQSAGWYGTWVEDTAGMVIVALDSTQTEFNTINKTGGSKYLQEHEHFVRVQARVYQDLCYGLDAGFFAGNPSGNGQYTIPRGSGNVSGVTTGNSGNLQPYKVARRWHRTA